MKFSVILLLIFCVCQPVLAQQSEDIPSPIIFIYDASGSMWGQIDGKAKIEIAAEVLSEAVQNLPDNQKPGLVAYGHRVKSDCEDVEFLVDFESGTREQVSKSLSGIKPLGKTPLAYSATLVIDKLRTTKQKATIILVTDGIESCSGNICDVVADAKKEGIDFRMHIVGFGLKEGETEQLECAAAAADGKYFDAQNAQGLSDVLIEATSETIDDPPGNFSVFVTRNNSSIDAIVLAFKQGSDEEVDQVRTYRDTALLYLPEGKYDLKIQALEHSDLQPKTVKGIQSSNDKIAHQTISFDAAKIEVEGFNNGESWDCAVNLIDKNSGKSIARVRTYAEPRIMEVDPGVYDLEIRALVIEGLDIVHTIENIQVEGGETKRQEHKFQSGIAMVGVSSKGELVDCTVNFHEEQSGKNIAGARTYTSESSNPKKFILSPGVYNVKVVSLGAHKGYSDTFKLTVKQGETVEKLITF